MTKVIRKNWNKQTVPAAPPSVSINNSSFVANVPVNEPLLEPLLELARATHEIARAISTLATMAKGPSGVTALNLHFPSSPEGEARTAKNGAGLFGWEFAKNATRAQVSRK